MNGTDVQTTLREMWETRPARPRRDRKVAGVAAALARRYDIDPVLVRVGLVVSAFYGVGLALYALGWLLLPGAAEDDPADGATVGMPGSGAKAGPLSTPMKIALVVALAIVAGVFFGSTDVIVPILVVGGLLFLLHRSRGRRAFEAHAASADAPTVAAPRDPAGGGEADPQPDSPPLSPPAWDPLGAAPFAWDLPEPSPVEPAAVVPPRSRVTPVTLALAVAGGGVAGIIMLVGPGLLGLPTVFATMLAIVGAGLVVGAFRRSGRGLVPIALILALLTWASLAVMTPDRGLDVRGGVGDTNAAPRSAAEVLPVYSRTLGSVQLDLRDLDLTAAPGADAVPIRTSADVGTGAIEVRVPENADVTVVAHAGMGDVSFGDRSESGPDATVTVTDDLGADGVRSGRPIELTLNAGLGSVEVHRG
ncbi:MAG: PspC domain-containing protein [Pseudonocardia sp.]|nr:PspC domain-containing protein [Pseudonocardia sp.]